jgi:hypothetical protein
MAGGPSALQVEAIDSPDLGLGKAMGADGTIDLALVTAR